MPIARIGQKIVYFAHVPKCAGSSIEDYLAARFGPLGFIDRRHVSHPPEVRWNRSSPQHIDTETLDRLFPAAFFDARFAMVRHPAERLRSVFVFQRDVERKIPRRAAFSDWLRRQGRQQETAPYRLDNHARPMDQIVPAESVVFRLEEGEAPLIAWLDELAGTSDGPRHLPHSNTRAEHEALLSGKPKGDIPQISEEDHHWIATHYAADFSRFGYDPGPLPGKTEEPAA